MGMESNSNICLCNSVIYSYKYPNKKAHRKDELFKVMLNGHYFLVLIAAVLVYQFYVLIGNALYTSFGIFRCIFAKAIFLQFSYVLHCVAAYVTHGYFCMFAFAVHTLYQFLTALFSKRWKIKSDNITIVLRVKAYVRCYDRFFYRAKHLFFPWLDGQCTGIGNGHVS